MSRESNGKPQGTFVQVKTEYRIPNDRNPELSGQTTSTTGSGCVVDLKEFSTEQGLLNEFVKTQLPRFAVITNAHVAKQFPAKIEIRFVCNDQDHCYQIRIDEDFSNLVGHDCDLALLLVNPEQYNEFEQHVTPVVFSKSLPAQSAEISVIGFPQGSDALAVTKGNVTRYRHSSYSHSKTSRFNMEVTAPINGGNSGGGIVDSEGKLVAIVHQGNSSGQNQGYAIPVPVVKRFLTQCFSFGRYVGSFGWPLFTQALENRTTRKALNLPDQVKGGVLVTEVAPLFYRKNQECSVQPGDVLLAINGVSINCREDIFNFCNVGSPLNYRVLVAEAAIDQGISLTFWRNSSEITVGVNLATPMDYYLRIPRVPRVAPAIPYIYCQYGVVFIKGTHAKLLAHNTNNGNNVGQILYSVLNDSNYATEKAPSVVYAYIRNTRENGYHEEPFVVRAVNGRWIRHMNDVARVLKESDDDILRIQADDSQTPNIFLKKLTPEQWQMNREQYQIIAETNMVSTRGLWRKAISQTIFNLKRKNSNEHPEEEKVPEESPTLK